MKHYLVTLWNVDLYDLGWLQRRQRLFEKYTLPSVKGQNSKDFEWLLISDVRTPDKFKNVLDRYPARTVYYDWENYKWTSLKGIDDDSPMGLAVRVETIGDVIAGAIGEQDVPVITSRLDNDDMISKEHIRRTRLYAEKLWAKRGPKFWITMVRGSRLSNGKMYPVNSKCSSFTSFVEDGKNLKTAYQCVHTLANRTEYPLEIIREGEPTWCEVIHGENVMNRLKRYRGEHPATKEELGRFSVNG